MLTKHLAMLGQVLTPSYSGKAVGSFAFTNVLKVSYPV